jgi:hypothetical protein
MICLAMVPAGASVITSLPGGTIVPMPAVNYFGGAPQVFGPGITWTSTNGGSQGGSVFGYNGGYGFSGNGSWDGSFVMAGLNDSFDNYSVTDTMTFTFLTPIDAVGGFLSYVPGGSTATTIAIYDSLDNLIESFNLTFLTDGSNNSGQFYGFQASGAIISKFTLTDNYIGIRDLTIGSSVAEVPEPGTFLPVAAGLLALAAIGRRKIQALRQE